jgi:hypothetical protein
MIGGQITEAWICARCKMAHHAVQKEHQNMRGPADATALLNADARGTGVHYLTWATPRGQETTVEYYTYPRTIPMTHPEPLLFSLWELLQSKVKIIVGDDRGDKTDDEIRMAMQQARYEGRGIAEALAILMKPFMQDADAVVRAAVAYYKDPTYQVNGLGTHLWDPMYNPDGTLRVKMNTEVTKRTRTPVKAAPPKPTAKKLSEADIAFCKASSEMFSVEDLAGMFKVSVAEVQAVLA